MELVKNFFSFTQTIKLHHWQTESYAVHIATDQLHTALLPLVDQFVEVYQGRHNKRVYSASEPTVAIAVKQCSEKEFIKFLSSSKEFLLSLESLGFIQPSTDNDLQNIRDEMLAQLNKTLYLLTFK